MIAPGVPFSDDDAQSIAETLACYREPRTGRAWLELALSAIPFVILSLTALVGIRLFSWFFLMLSLPAAGFLVRLFLIQHDCGHGSFFRGRNANDALGRTIGVLTFTPYGYWRYMHARHHATSGNLDRRGSGDIALLTVGEYRTLSSWGRLAYRLVRNPLVMFGLGSIYVFVFKQRLPVGMMGRFREGWGSVMFTNLAIIAFLTVGSLLFGALVFLVVQITTLLIAAATGIWLFYVQHQFEGTSWVRDDEWSFHR